MKRILFLLLMLPAQAARANIALSPLFLEFDADSKNRSKQVRFTNTTNEEMGYTIRLVNFRQEADGSYTPVKNPPEGGAFADEHIEFSPRLAKLKPMESQTVRVQRRGMASGADGEYVSHLLIQESPPEKKTNSPSNGKGLSIELRAIYGVSIPVMIKKGELFSSASIKGFKIADTTATAVIERAGTRSFLGTAIVKSGGEEIGRIENFRVFTTTKQRTLKIPLSQKPSAQAELILIDGRGDEILETKSI